ncbi:hypothetical protein D6D11_10288 [Aureobasidium pullulans]|nr:hypothetical protein D6D11_10288 [Aureobasidium pullulans]
MKDIGITSAKPQLGINGGMKATSKPGCRSHHKSNIFHFTLIVKTAGCGDCHSLSDRDNDTYHHDTQNLLIACRIPANKHHTTNIRPKMLSEPSSPTVFINAQEPLLNEIERLKEQYNRLEEDFAYYEESNGGLQVQVDNQASDIDAKDREISYLKELVDRTVRDHEKAHEEAEFLRRRSSVLEITVKANAKELNGLYEVEQLLTAREAEARLFAAELLEVKTDRDDNLAEVKGLEGDLERQQLVLDAKDREIDSLYERINIFERHISITKDLAVDELDDCLYDFVEKVTAIEGDVVKPSPPTSTSKKEKRQSFTGGFNLADEFDALSDGEEEYESEDDEGSDTRSVLSDNSVRSRKRRAKQALAMSALQYLEIQPSIKNPTASVGTQMSPTSPKPIKPLPQMASAETQTSPIKSPIKIHTSSAETQTSPISSPVKIETSSIETQTTPIASPIKIQTTNTGTQFSPVPSPVKIQTSSTETQTSPVASPIKAQTSSTETQTTPLASPVKIKTTNTGTQFSPVASPIKLQTSSTETQTTPIASPIKTRYINTATQFSPIASPVKLQTSSNETQTTPVASPIKPQYTNTATQFSPTASPIQAQTISIDTQTSHIASPIRPVSNRIETQTSPVASPLEAQTTNAGTQSSPIASPLSTKIQISPVATPIKAQTFGIETQNSPVISPSKAQHTSTGKSSPVTSPTRSAPKYTSNDTRTSPVASSPRREVLTEKGSQTSSSGVQSSPTSSPRRSIFEVISFYEMISSAASAAQKSPIVATLSKLTPGRSGDETQESPVAYSPKTQAPRASGAGVQSSPVGNSPRETTPITTSDAVQNKPVAASREKTAAEAFDFKPTRRNDDNPSQEQLADERQNSADSGVQPRRKRALEQPFEPRAMSSGLETNSGNAASFSPGINTLNTKRPRVPEKDTTPTILSPVNVASDRDTTSTNVSPINTVPPSSTVAIITKPADVPFYVNQRYIMVPTVWQTIMLEAQTLFLYFIAGYIGISIVMI